MNHHDDVHDSAISARRRLSAPAMPDDAPGPHGWTRRGFLQAVGAGMFAGASLGTIAAELFGGGLPEAWAGTPLGANDGVLVLVTMYGGNDGLNTLVPYANPTYYGVRPNLAIPADQVLKIDGNVGLHPELTYLKQLYDAGKVAVVQGVGYPNPDLSHFSSMAIWMNGRFGGGMISDGWIGRWLDSLPANVADLAALSLDSSVPLHLQGAVRRALAVSPGGNMFGTSTAADQKRLYDIVRSFGASSGGRGQLHDQFAATLSGQLDLATAVAPVFTAKFPTGDLARKLTVAARLINVDIGLRVIDVPWGGFDDHEAEPAKHAASMRDLNVALESFFATLAPDLQSRVTLMTASEFGRTPASNSSVGTDHGTAAPHFVIGAGVSGGLKGAAPSLDVLDKNKRMVSTVDFRSMYGTVLDHWLGGDSSAILNGGHDDLQLFTSGPGGQPTSTPLPIVVPPLPPDKTGFAPVAPLRVFDTRDGTGGRRGALAGGESWTFTFKDRFGIPGDATAVVLNLTSVDASEPSFVTSWPMGDKKPFTANLNPVPGLPVPNLVVAPLGAGGATSFFNNSGQVHLVGDLVGWFKTSSNNKLTPLTPARLLDTRDGTGMASAAPLGPSGTLDLVVTGRGGVPSDAAAVALNVTVTAPTAPSYLTVWPTGSTRPLAASLNMVPGQTVPNLVFAQVGKGGKVSLFNYAGSSQVVVDVLGSFGPSGTARYAAMTPVRVLDTRDGTGAAKGQLGQAPLALPLAGVKGIPASGVQAVLLNVTVVGPTADTYVTVYPTGGDRPLAANLNAIAGQVVPNMVIGRLGPDGAVAIFNFAGQTDLVADVMGYFTT